MFKNFNAALPRKDGEGAGCFKILGAIGTAAAVVIILLVGIFVMPSKTQEDTPRNHSVYGCTRPYLKLNDSKRVVEFSCDGITWEAR